MKRNTRFQKRNTKFFINGPRSTATPHRPPTVPGITILLSVSVTLTPGGTSRPWTHVARVLACLTAHGALQATPPNVGKCVRMCPSSLRLSNIPQWMVSCFVSLLLPSPPWDCWGQAWSFTYLLVPSTYLGTWPWISLTQDAFMEEMTKVRMPGFVSWFSHWLAGWPQQVACPLWTSISSSMEWGWWLTGQLLGPDVMTGVWGGCRCFLIQLLRSETVTLPCLTPAWPNCHSAGGRAWWPLCSFSMAAQDTL